MLFFLIFPETVRAEEEDQVGPQAQESFHDSSTDSCLTFPYSSNSPRPFPPSPVHSVTDSPIRVDLSPPLGLDLSEVMVEVPGVPILGEGELPGAEEAKSPPPPVVRPLPSPAIFGLIINQVQSPLEILLLIMP